jgi:hypothetical protein
MQNMSSRSYSGHPGHNMMSGSYSGHNMMSGSYSGYNMMAGKQNYSAMFGGQKSYQANIPSGYRVAGSYLKIDKSDVQVKDKLSYSLLNLPLFERMTYNINSQPRDEIDNL